MKRKRWKVPLWMTPYIRFITNTGGNPVGSLVNGNTDPRVNLPLSTIEAMAKSQVALLEALHNYGCLPEKINSHPLHSMVRRCGADNARPERIEEVSWAVGYYIGDDPTDDTPFQEDEIEPLPNGGAK